MRTLLFVCFALARSTAFAAEPTPAEIFEQRIMPIFKSPNPSSCVQCHLAGVDLKDYGKLLQIRILPWDEKRKAWEDFPHRRLGSNRERQGRLMAVQPHAALGQEPRSSQGVCGEAATAGREIPDEALPRSGREVGEGLESGVGGEGSCRRVGNHIELAGRLRGHDRCEVCTKKVIAWPQQVKVLHWGVVQASRHFLA